MKLFIALAVVIALAVCVALARTPGRGKEAARESIEAHAQQEEIVPELAQASAVAVDEPKRASNERAAMPVARRGESSSPGAFPFHGIVLDGLSGEPIEGARALVQRSPRSAPPDELPSNEIECEARSDVRGRFVLMPGRESVTGGWLVADGYGPGIFACDGLHGSADRARVIELLPGANLEVVVRDAAGVPEAGATVALRRPAEAVVQAGIVATLGRIDWSVAVDVRGIATFAGLPAEVALAWSVLCPSGAGGRAGEVALAPGETRRIEVIVGGAARLFGHVRDADRAPVAGLALALCTSEGESRQARAKARTDEEGRFEFDELPFETFTLGVLTDAQGWVVARDDVIVVDQPVVEHDVVVERGLFLEGRVLGSPAEVPALTFVHARSVESAGHAESALEEGRFRVGPLLPGDWLVSATGPAFSTDIARASAGASDVVLRVLPTRDISIRIEGGESLGQLVYSDQRQGSLFSISISPVEPGEVVPLELAPGKYLLVGSNGDSTNVLEIEVDDSSPQEVVMQLQPGARCTFVNGARQGAGELRLLLDGVPLPLPFLPLGGSNVLLEGAARTVLVPPRPLVAELVEGERVVARAEFAPRPGERLRVVLEPR